jgi:ribosome-binding protein aMBF1 (putative translation factor)
MNTNMPDTSAVRHRLLPEKAGPAMAKADLRKAETPDAWKTDIGLAIERVQKRSGWSLKEFADKVGRNERQVKRWMTADERPQFDALFAVAALRHLMVLALAELAGEGVEVTTEIRMRRIA